MEKGEAKAQAKYKKIFESVPGAMDIEEDENEHLGQKSHSLLDNLDLLR